MKIVVFKSPKLFVPFLRKIFKILADAKNKTKTKRHPIGCLFVMRKSD